MRLDTVVSWLHGLNGNQNNSNQVARANNVQKQK